MTALSTSTGRWSALLLAATWVALGCSKEATPTAEQPKAPAQGQPAAVVPAAATGDKAGTEPAGAQKEGAEETAGEGEAVDLKAAKATYAETTFALSIKPSGEYKAGQPATVEIVLEAKAPFHANEKYPYKFKTAPTSGVTFPAAIVKKDQAKVENMKVTMPVAFSAEAGKKRVHGVFHFSVCTDDKCLIEKRALALEVDVK